MDSYNPDPYNLEPYNMDPYNLSADPYNFKADPYNSLVKLCNPRDIFRVSSLRMGVEIIALLPEFIIQLASLSL